jgi:hypothetical protein
MRGALNILVRVLCAALILAFIAGPRFIPFEVPVPSLAWLHVQLGILYLGTAVWAILAYRKADRRTHRMLFFSIVGVAVLIFATEAMAWAQPHLAAVLHHPIETALGYLFAALVIFGVLVAERSSRRAQIAALK